MNKVLRLNVVMDLPDDFDGGLREAFELYLAKRAAPCNEAALEHVSVRVAWEAFAVNRRHGASVVAEDGIFSLRSGSWRRLDARPVGGMQDKDVWVK